MNDTLNTVAALAAVAISVVGATIALLARRDSKRSAKAAEATIALERERRHGELTPTLTASATVQALGRGFGDSRVRLTLRLAGPAGLSNLNKVTVRIRDEPPNAPARASGPVQQDPNQVVWAPYHLVPHVDGADQLGRTSGPFQMRPGGEQHFELKPTLPPRGGTNEQAWADQYADTPIRLDVECVREGYDPWTVLVEADQPRPKFDAEGGPRETGFAVTFRNVGTAAARQPGITTDHPNRTPTLTGTYRDVIDPGQAAQTVRIANTAGHTHEWVRLAWIDPRGAHDDLRAGLRL